MSHLFFNKRNRILFSHSDSSPGDNITIAILLKVRAIGREVAIIKKLLLLGKNENMLVVNILS